jgi:hypothetical protein
MVKPVDITNTILVPKPQPRQDRLDSFFIGRADQVIEPLTEITVNTKDKIKQPHLDNSVIKDTEWKDLY